MTSPRAAPSSPPPSDDNNDGEPDREEAAKVNLLNPANVKAKENNNSHQESTGASPLRPTSQSRSIAFISSSSGLSDSLQDDKDAKKGTSQRYFLSQDDQRWQQPIPLAVSASPQHSSNAGHWQPHSQQQQQQQQEQQQQHLDLPQASTSLGASLSSSSSTSSLHPDYVQTGSPRSKATIKNTASQSTSSPSQPQSKHTGSKRTSFFRSAKLSSSKRTDSSEQVASSSAARQGNQTSSFGSVGSVDSSAAGRASFEDIQVTNTGRQSYQTDKTASPSFRTARSGFGSTIQPGYQFPQDRSQFQSQSLDEDRGLEGQEHYLQEPDDYDIEQEYQRALQRQFQHRLRVLDRPSPGQSAGSSGTSSLLAKFKNPLGKFHDTQYTLASSGPRSQTQSQPAGNLTARHTSFSARPGTGSLPGEDLDRIISLDEHQSANADRSFPGANHTASEDQMFLSATTTSGTSAGADGTNTFSSKNRPKPVSGLPEEQKDVSQSVLIWRRDVKHGGSGKNFLPQVPGVARKITKRDKNQNDTSYQQKNGPNIAGSPSGSESGRLNQLAQTWLRERPSKSRLGTSSGDKGATIISIGAAGASSAPQLLSHSRKEGSWKSGKVTFRENGSLYIFGQDRTLLHDVQADRLKITDVRPVDDSLFGRSNVLGIFARPPIFAGRKDPSSSPASQSSTTASTTQQEEPIYIALPSSQKLRLWMALLHTYGIPEIFCHPNDVKTGGMHRWYRQIDMSLMEFKPTTNTTQTLGPNWQSVAAGLPTSVQPFGAATPRSKAASVDLPVEARREAWMPTTSPRATPFQCDSSIGHGELMSTRQSISSISHNHGRTGSIASQSSFATSASGGGEELATNSMEHVADRSAMTADDSTSLYDTSNTSYIPRKALDAQPSSGAFAQAQTTLDSTMSHAEVSPLVRAAAKVKNSAKGGDRESHYGSASSGATTHHPVPSAVYCMMYVNGILSGCSSVRAADSTGDVFWPEKFSFKNLDTIKSLRIDVFQPIGGSSSSAASAPGSGTVPITVKGGKSILIGSIDIPVVSFRRGEEISSFFPVWSTRAPLPADISSGGRAKSLAFESLGAECIGRVKLSLKFKEESVRLREKYAVIQEQLNSAKSISLIRDLAKNFEEQPTTGLLVDVYTSTGLIADRLTDLIVAESENWDQTQPELLFRGSSLLTRSVDQFQRLYCRDWLDASVGEQVRYICENGISVGIEDLSACAASGKGAWEKDESFSHASASGRPGSSAAAIEEGSPVDVVRTITADLWKNIYANRHNCPVDLRKVLSEVRRRVNTKFGAHLGAAPGMQGVGAFVFLRLICPAITTPHLYGLMAFAPDPQSSGKVLRLVAKILLGLANKRGAAFDKDKESGLGLMNDFLHQTAPAYDDYITLVSTAEPDPYASGTPRDSNNDTKSSYSSRGSPKRQKPKRALMPLKAAVADQDDRAVQKMIGQKLPHLLQIHREAVASPPYMLDQSLAFATLVSYIARNADGSLFTDDVSEGGASVPAARLNDETLGSAYSDRPKDLSSSAGDPLHTHASADEDPDANRSRSSSEGMRTVAKPSVLQKFVEECLDCEHRLGYYIDRAGFVPVLLSLLQQDSAKKSVKKTAPYSVVSTWKSDSAKAPSRPTSKAKTSIGPSSPQLASGSDAANSFRPNQSRVDSPTSGDETSLKVGNLRGRRATASSLSDTDPTTRLAAGPYGSPPTSGAGHGAAAAAAPDLSIDASLEKGDSSGPNSILPPSSSTNSMATVVPASANQSRVDSFSSGEPSPVRSPLLTAGRRGSSVRCASPGVAGNVSSPPLGPIANASPQIRTRARAATASASTSAPPKRMSTEYASSLYSGNGGNNKGSRMNHLAIQPLTGSLPWQGNSSTTTASSTSRHFSLSRNVRSSRSMRSSPERNHRPLTSTHADAGETTAGGDKGRKWWQRK